MSPTIRIIRKLTAAMYPCYQQVAPIDGIFEPLPGHQRTTAKQDVTEAKERFDTLFQSIEQAHQLNPRLRALALLNRNDANYLAVIDSIVMHPDFGDDTLDLCFSKFKNNPREYRDLELRGAMIVYSYLDA